MCRISPCSTVAVLFVLMASSSLFGLEGSLEWKEITSPALEGNLIGDSATRTIGIYLPPDYQNSSRPYPVVYALTGYDMDLSAGWFQENLEQGIFASLEAIIQDGEIEELIYVIVDGYNKFGGSWYLSSPTIGDWESI